MKTRTMVYLESEEIQALRMEAAKKGISLAELMRRLVRLHLEKGKPESPAPPWQLSVYPLPCPADGRAPGGLPSAGTPTGNHRDTQA